jgi:DNA-binding NarL/FixJ family response regulator
MNITPRQKTIIFWLSKELKNKQIAQKVNKSLATVKRDLQKLYINYDVQGRIGLVQNYNVSLDRSPAEI